MSTTEARPAVAPQTLDGAKAWLRHHLEMRRYPMNVIDVPAAVRTIAALDDLDPVPWSRTWLSSASAFEEQAEAAEAAGDRAAARAAWFQAYQFAFMGRFPVPTHSSKVEAYERSRTYFLRAVSLDEPIVERIEVPFSGREGEGDRVSFYVARPTGVENPPVVIIWGGIEAWKEEMLFGAEQFWGRGIATVLVDMPGVGEAPILAGVDAERMFDPVFTWIENSDFDSERVAVLGASFGGYWATKLAHTHRDKLVAAVNWAGGIHITFQPHWQEQSRYASSYLIDLMAGRARIFGGTSYEDYVARAPELSLLDQGVLDTPCAPLLIVNGRDDQQNSAEDALVAVEHGDPKTVRLFEGGHMGGDMKTIRLLITDWISERLTSDTKKRN